jgi:glycosyltransferase involved in cell wall biosynthesis
MRTTCLINSYNYCHLVVEAVESAMRQTLPFDEIIIVDDGSSDGTGELIRAQYGCQPRVRLVEKENEGQLSCFNEGFAHSTGDILFFLDADDFYEPGYVEETVGLYESRPDVDFVCSGHRRTGSTGQATAATAPTDEDFGYTLLLTMFGRRWIGGPTSCLSARRQLLSKVLPIPYLEDWRIRADDCLVFGASLVGGRKYYRGSDLVNYRVHESNAFAGRRPGAGDTYKRKVAINRLFKLFADRMGYEVETLPDFAHHEFRTAGSHSAFGRLRAYTGIVWRSKLSFSRKLAIIAGLACTYVFRRFSPSAGAESGRGPNGDDSAAAAALASSASRVRAGSNL